ncbi:MAG: RNA polymerase subunit sigma-24 [Thermoanaerobacteraceae bacterium]|jgi:primosomal protein N''|nr:RNA polymerase subunit sigma-24 [Thermoanaerobacteraceae bacterium]
MTKKITKKELKQIKHLKSEIEMLKKQVENLDYVVTTDTVKGSTPYFPYIERNIKITGIDYKDYNRRLKRLQRMFRRRIEELMDLVEQANEYIGSIEDSLMRQILTLRYINGLTWEQVAASIGGNNTADSVRKAAERFLAKG